MRVQQPPQIKNYVCVGVLTGAHGIQGDVKFKPFIDDLSVFHQKETKFITNYQETITIQQVKSVGGAKIALKVAEITNRNQAEESMGIFLYTLRENLSDDIIEADLLDLDVTLNGRVLGHVHNVFDNGAQLVMEIQLIENKEVLIPVVDKFVESVSETEIILTQEAEIFLAL